MYPHCDVKFTIVYTSSQEYIKPVKLAKEHATPYLLVNMAVS